uniref:GST N-terminal domain-containing protein n=1 Tax=Aplanochytrium stocchinoi TaxID=215587 RepID=A0A7S3LJ26_9STRA|mmetsp:Transcript_11725/g.13573  ORF Transcript_11725/g.13573 Transcript_11725/m.13573 type:complete len:271 (+) Transcript_11725:175-987(+)
MAPQPERLTVYTISLSHYCDAGRWALQVAGKPYQEIPYIPGFHQMFGPMKRFRKNAMKTMGRDSEAIKRPFSTPCVLDDKGVIVANECWDCIELVGPVNTALKDLLNDVVGPATRCIAYSHILREENDKTLLKIATAPPIPFWQRALFRITVLRRGIASKMTELMVHNEEFVQGQRDKLNEALRQIQTMMEGDESDVFNLDGQEISATGLAVAALLCPLSGASGAPGYSIEDLPESMVKEIHQWLEDPVVMWAHTAYEKFRNQGNRDRWG